MKFEVGWRLGERCKGGAKSGKLEGRWKESVYEWKMKEEDKEISAASCSAKVQFCLICF